MSELKDSGERQDFESGCVRDAAENKSRPDLISPYFMMRVGEHLDKGARKYAERNWEKGMPISRCIASLERHLNQYKMGLTDEDHLAAISCNIIFIIHYEEMIKRGLLPEELADLPQYEGPVLRGSAEILLKEKVTVDYSRNGETWTKQEELDLRVEVAIKNSVDDMALRHKRTRLAIESRMEKLGLKLQENKNEEPKIDGGCNAAFYQRTGSNIMCHCKTCRSRRADDGVQSRGESADRIADDSETGRDDDNS